MNKESKNKERETISAYLDDALPQTEVDELSLMGNTVLGQEESRKRVLGTASRYQLIGEVLRGQVSDASMTDVCLQVREALKHEEMAQENLDVSKSVNAEKDRKHSKSGSTFNLVSWLGSAWYRPVGGLAVAASVAMIMVVTAPHDEVISNNNLVADSRDNGVPVVSLPVATSVARETGVSKLADQSSSQVNLDAYLAEHAEFAAQDTMQGRIPYARYVSHETE